VKAVDALRAAFSALASDGPAIHARVIDRLKGLTLSCRIGREGFALRFVGGALQVCPPLNHPSPIKALPRFCVEVGLSPETLLALLDGTSTADAAVRRRRLWLRGQPRDLASLSRASRDFIHGATASRRAERVLAEYRAAVQNARATM
jgi:hypothetical protein